jgi:putative two-component system response regulator
LLLLEDRGDLEARAAKIFKALSGTYRKFPITISMGISRSRVTGPSYLQMFLAADQALYTAKRSGRNKYLFYKDSMQTTLSDMVPSGVISSTI